jgi:hypothetical protein
MTVDDSGADAADDGGTSPGDLAPDLPEITLADGHTSEAQLSRLRGDMRSLSKRVRHVEDGLAEIQDKLQTIEEAGRRLLNSDLLPSESDVAAPQQAAAGDPAGDAEEGMAGSEDEASPAEAAGADEDEDAVEELDFRSLVAWVRANVLSEVDRAMPRGKAPHWCQEWWRHPEALSRLSAVHSSWREASQEPVGNTRVVYWEHLDHQLGMLMSEHGPFRGCTREEHDPVADGRKLPHREPDDEDYLAFADYQPGTTAPADAAAPADPSQPSEAGSPAGPPAVPQLTTGRARPQTGRSR